MGSEMCIRDSLKGEHIGLIGANGEGKSTFMNIITGKLTPDEGTVEWAKNVRAGYLDQHAVLEEGMTIGDVLRSAFSWLFEMETEMNQMFEQMAEATPEEMERLLEETGTYQELLDQHNFPFPIMQSTTHALHYLSTIIYMLFFNIVHITDKFEYVHDFIFTEDARVKSLKPRCACTGVVLQWIGWYPSVGAGIWQNRNRTVSAGEYE